MRVGISDLKEGNIVEIPNLSSMYYVEKISYWGSVKSCGILDPAYSNDGMKVLLVKLDHGKKGPAKKHFSVSFDENGYVSGKEIFFEVVKNKFLDFAVKIAGKAGDNIMKYYGSQLKRNYTDPTHFKAVVDDKNDKLARLAIEKQFPSHSILSEKSMPKKTNSDFTWVIDGIDGTINFSTGFDDHFAFCMALCRGKMPIVGVVNAPKRGGLAAADPDEDENENEGGELYTAEIGGGAFCNGKRIQVSNLTDVSKVLMWCGSGKFNRTAHLPYIKKLLSPKGIICPFVTGCASVPLCLTASGVIHAFLATSLNPEDIAAGVILIREAGGKVTNLKGGEWQLGDESILAANLVLHQKLFKFLTQN